MRVQTERPMRSKLEQVRLVRVRPRHIVFVAAWLAAACGPTLPAEDPSRAALRTGAAPPADPTLRPAHLVPLRGAEEAKSFGAEPGGGTRMLVSGVRIVKLAGGGVQSASDPLPAPPSTTVEIPERLGGGFLFAIGPTIYRAKSWLAPLEMIYAAPLAPTQLFVGLDRAYVRLSNGAYAAFDAKTGDPMDLGPWPASPQVTRYAAADGWRAVAIADLRGAVATFDAGGRWQSLDLPIQPKEVVQRQDALVVLGTDSEGVMQGYAVQPNGQIARLASSDLTPHVEKKEAEDPQQAASKNPIVSAVLDGWPLEGGTALFARDGTLSRVRMSDGVVVDTAPDAFALKPAHCNAVSLSAPKTPAVIGFVCGVPRGATEIYAYDPGKGKLDLLRHFDGPRAVFSPSNGTLVVEGACDPEAKPVDVKKTEQTYCIMRKNRTFDDFIVNGDVGTERIVPLADGRTAIVSPPIGDIGTGRITLFDGSKVKTIAISFSKTPSSPTPHAKRDDDDDDDSETAPDDEQVVRAVLRSGTWLRGIEERTPGILSAWVAHSGRYVGVEVALDGSAKHGPYVADLGTAVVSGRYGLGWTASRQGYETTDGGMSWKPIVLPEPLESIGPAAGASTHGCGPLGCVLAGWIRVGWGETAASGSMDAATAQTPRTTSVASPSSVRLRCEPTGRPSPAGLDTTATAGNSGYGYGYPYYGGYYGRYGRYYGRQPQTQDWQPFFHVPAPKLATDDLGYSRRIDDLYDRSGPPGNSGYFSLSAVGRLYAWGPKGMDWDSHGHYLFRFTSPFEPSSVQRATQSTTIPDYVASATNFISLGGYITQPIQTLGFVPGDDADHALATLQRYSTSTGANETILVELAADRPATEIHREDGQALGDLESAVRMAGRWYLATSEPATTPGQAQTLAWTGIWVVEAGQAREVVRLPRATFDSSRAPAVRLARRADGRMLAAIVDGTPATEGAQRPTRWENQTWALPIDASAGTVGEPERLGLSDGSGKTQRVCGPEDGGWVADGRWPGGPISLTSANGAVLSGYTGSGVYTRYHVTPKSLCVEKVAVNGYADVGSAGKLGRADGASASASIFVDHTRHAFRCVQSP